MTERGLFITFEGGEGSGKSTQIKRLADKLESRGQTCVVTREPGGCPVAEKIRGLFLGGEPGEMGGDTELLLINAARAAHVRDVISPALTRGDWVLCDRFSDSTMAYQGFGRGIDPKRIRELDRWTLGGLKPDLTLLLDLDPAVGLGRTQTRGGDGETRFERESLAFHETIRQAFLEIALGEPDRIRLINAGEDETSVFNTLWEAVESLR